MQEARGGDVRREGPMTLRIVPAAVVLAVMSVVADGPGDSAFAQTRVRRTIEGPVTRAAIVRSLSVVPAEADTGGQTEVGVLLRIGFDFDSAALTPDAMRDLDRVAAALEDARLAGVPVTLEGHTDGAGDADYNRRLSRRRAETVAAYLVRRGIAGDRLRAVGHGADRPLPEHPPTDRRQRRVEIVRAF